MQNSLIASLPEGPWVKNNPTGAAPKAVILTGYQWDVLLEFRSVVEGFLPEEYTEDDAFLLRWLVVLLFPWGKWKPWIFTTGKLMQLYQKYMDYMINKLVAAIKPPAEQFVIIGDSDGFTYGHMKYIKSLEANLQAVRAFDAHYPELMHSAICINCPSTFTLVFSLIKPMMSQRTRNKLNIFGTDKQCSW